ncbi:hypothetical protein [Aromatoleum sp.]|uniref:hypothetical protein n=1 Tax=Aromatoleum sp. TaxID=2307007 RepID=UPI002FC65370
MTSGLAAAAPPLAELSAAGVAARIARKRPAIVVLWTPDCLACRKSLAEVERFAAGRGSNGIPVRTVVPAAAYDDARELVATRGLALEVESAAGELDTVSHRVLLDKPVAYAFGRGGEIKGAHAGLLGAWILEDLASDAMRPSD